MSAPGYRAYYGVGTVQAGEGFFSWVPQRGGRRARSVLLLHGAGVPAQYLSHADYASAGIPAALARDGFTSVAGGMAGDAFGNDTAQARVESHRTLAASALGTDPAKAHVVGISMGGYTALRYAVLNPSKVASLTLILPLCDIVAAYNANTAGLRPAIQTAWGVTYPTPLPAGADLTASAGAIASAGIPVRFWYDDADAVIDPASVLAMAALTGGTTVEIAADLGHTIAEIAQVGLLGARAAWSDVCDFIINADGIGVTAPTLVLTAAGQSTATLTVTGGSTVPLILGAVSAQSGATLGWLGAIPLSSAAAHSAATLNLAAGRLIPLSSAAAQSAATLALKAKTAIPLGTAAASSSATLALSTPSTPPFLAGFSKAWFDDCTAADALAGGIWCAAPVDTVDSTGNAIEATDNLSTPHAMSTGREARFSSGGPHGKPSYRHFWAPKYDNIYSSWPTGRASHDYPHYDDGVSTPGPSFGAGFLNQGQRNIYLVSIRLRDHVDYHDAGGDGDFSHNTGGEAGLTTTPWDQDYRHADDGGLPGWRVLLQWKQNEWVGVAQDSPILSFQQTGNEWRLVQNDNGVETIIWAHDSRTSGGGGGVNSWVNFAFDLTGHNNPTLGKAKVYADFNNDGGYEYASSQFTLKTLCDRIGGGSGVESMFSIGVYEHFGGDSCDFGDISIYH